MAQAARYGLDGNLVDLAAPRSAPAVQRVEALLEFVRPSLEATGDWVEVSEIVRATPARGTGAHRQREAFARTGRLADVVDEIVTEATRGTA